MKLFQLRLQEAFAIDSSGRVKSDAILFSFGDGTHRYFFWEHSLKYLSQNRYNDIIWLAWHPHEYFYTIMFKEFICIENQQFNSGECYTNQ